MDNPKFDMAGFQSSHLGGHLGAIASRMLTKSNPTKPEVMELADAFMQAKADKDALRWLYNSIPEQERQTPESLALAGQIEQKTQAMSDITEEIKALDPDFFKPTTALL